MATLTLAICARNAQNIIGDCLAAIHNQTVPPDEILVAVAVTTGGRPLPRVGGLQVSEIKGEDGLR